MKSIVTIIFLFLVVFVPPARSQAIKSDAIDYMEEAFYAAEEDLSARYSFDHMIEAQEISSSLCRYASVSDAYLLLDKAINFYQSYYSDEELPIDEAKSDLLEHMSNKAGLSMCVLDSVRGKSYIFLDLQGQSVFQLHYISY